MSSAGRFRRFASTYSPVFVFVPGFVVAHWAWYRLQDNELFVTKEQRDSHPLMVWADKHLDTLKEKVSSFTTSPKE